MSKFYEDAVDLLRTIDKAGIQPGAIQFTESYDRVEIDTWYASGDERAACDAVVELVLGTQFDYEMRKDIGFPKFTGAWRSLNVIINASADAGYEWTCNDPIVEAVSA